MSLKKATHLRAEGGLAGDCIDCQQCVAVCPTGVDIRYGADLGCIQCGLCIDACDDVMTKIGRPNRLIAYDTDVNIKRRQSGLSEIFRPFRARTLLYAGLILLVSGLMAYTLITRAPFTIRVIHDRNPIFVKLSNGHIRNAFTMRVANMLMTERNFTLNIDGIKHAQIEIVGGIPVEDNATILVVGPDQTREFRVLVTHDAAPKEHEPTALSFVLRDESDGRTAMARDFFRTPYTIH